MPKQDTTKEIPEIVFGTELMTRQSDYTHKQNNKKKKQNEKHSPRHSIHVYGMCVRFNYTFECGEFIDK